MKKWLLVVVILLVGVLAWRGIVLIQKVNEPQKLQAKKATEIIKDSYDIKEIFSIQQYAGLSKAYQVADVMTTSKERLYIWVAEKTQETYSVNAKEGLSETEAISMVKAKENPKQIVRATPGLEGNKQNLLPIWEVVFVDSENRYTFYYINFKTGDYLQSYRINKTY